GIGRGQRDQRDPAALVMDDLVANTLRTAAGSATGSQWTCMGLFLSSGCFWVLLSVLCSERERPFFVPSPAIRFAERAEGVKGPKRQQSLAACRLASLVFRSALTPEHAEQ